MNQMLLGNIKGCGPKLTQSFRKEHIWSTYDLVLKRPKRYEDFMIKDLETANHDETITVIGKIAAPLKTFKKGKLSVTSTKIEIGSNLLNVTVFNQPYLKDLPLGIDVVVKGKYNLFKRSMVAQMISKNLNHMSIKPIYGYKEIKDHMVTNLLTEIFANKWVEIYETLPLQIIKKRNLTGRFDAYQTLHLPKQEKALFDAIYRFKYEEAFLQQLRFIHRLNQRPKRTPRVYDLDKIKTYIKQIPYELTDDQKKAVNDIFRDFKQPFVSYRLIQGDVGSGKTIVSFLAALGMITAGLQVALMAPTETLANQHYQNFAHLFPNIKTALLTGSVKDKASIKTAITEGGLELVIGTQALLTDDVVFKDLGMVIIDEQHKFGVGDRNDLIDKAKEADVIYLTATPIPRSMAMAYFGYMDYTIIKEKPKHQQLIKTSLYDDKKMDLVLERIAKNMDHKEQSYVVVPAILKEHRTHNIENVHAWLSQHIDTNHLYLMHSKLKSSQQEQMMQKFINDTQGVLLATTMIEVGIDVKNATLMVILGAHYFGLSQLHQLRGRIGRGRKASECILVSDRTDTERLEVMETVHDGFSLSNYDLKLRGPGDLLGDMQSGFTNYEYLDFTSDMNIVIEARKEAATVYDNIDQYPYLKRKIDEQSILNDGIMQLRK